MPCDAPVMTATLGVELMTNLRVDVGIAALIRQLPAGIDAPVWQRRRMRAADSTLDEVDDDVDVAARGLGVRANLMRGVNHGLGDLALQPRQPDVETGA